MYEGEDIFVFENGWCLEGPSNQTKMCEVMKSIMPSKKIQINFSEAMLLLKIHDWFNCPEHHTQIRHHYSNKTGKIRYRCGVTLTNDH